MVVEGEKEGGIREREIDHRFDFQVQSLFLSLSASFPFYQDDQPGYIRIVDDSIGTVETQVTDSFHPCWPTQPEARLITADLTAVLECPGLDYV